MTTKSRTMEEQLDILLTYLSSKYCPKPFSPNSLYENIHQTNFGGSVVAFVNSPHDLLAYIGKLETDGYVRKDPFYKDERSYFVSDDVELFLKNGGYVAVREEKKTDKKIADSRFETTQIIGILTIVITITIALFTCYPCKPHSKTKSNTQTHVIKSH